MKIMERRITATQAVRSFSELLNRVKYRGEEFIVERGGEAICRISPITSSGTTLADLAGLLKSLPRMDEEYLKAVEEAARQKREVPESPWER